MRGFHAQVLDVGQKIGYYSKVFPGVCFGYILKLLEAYLLDEEEVAQFKKFKRDIARASQKENLLEKLNLVKIKVKNNQSLNKEEQDLLDLLAFYETMTLFHAPITYSRFFNKPYNQCDIKHSSYLAGSEKMRAHGGLTSIYSEIGIYSKTKIKELLEQYEEAINKLDYPKEKITFLLGSEDHTIGLIYNKKTWRWTLANISNESFIEPTEIEKDNADIESLLEPPEMEKDSAAIAEDIFNSFRVCPEIETIENDLQETANGVNKPEYVKKGASFLIPYSAPGNGVVLTYQPSTQLWSFPQDQINQFSTKEMAKNINERFMEANKDDHIAFYSTFVSTTRDAHTFHLQDQFHQLKTPQPLTEEILQRKAIGKMAFIAADIRDSSTLANLISRGVDLNKATSHTGFGPLFLAAKYGAVALVQCLIGHVDINAQNILGETAVFAAAKYNHVEVIKILSDAGADLNIKSIYGFTPIHIASLEGNLEAVQMLIQCKADLDKPTKEGNTPLHTAAHGGHKDILLELLVHHAKADLHSFQGKTAAYYAAEKGYTDIISILSQYSKNIHRPDFYGVTPLYISCKKGHVDTVRELIKQSADINIKTHKGMSPIFVAALHGHANVISVLLQNKCDATIPFISDTSVLKGIAKIKGIAAVERMDKFIDNNLSSKVRSRSSSYDYAQLQTEIAPEPIEITAQEITEILGHQEATKIFASFHRQENFNNSKQTFYQSYNLSAGSARSQMSEVVDLGNTNVAHSL